MGIVIERGEFQPEQAEGNALDHCRLDQAVQAEIGGRQVCRDDRQQHDVAEADQAERHQVAAIVVAQGDGKGRRTIERSEEHTSELQSLMRISYAVFCLKKKNTIPLYNTTTCVAL